jgi:uncharacterized membrane protein YphA (DoxX/SURF4 family)
MKNKYFLLACRVIVGAFFIWAGALKVFHPLGFAGDIMAYGIFPRGLALIAALTLPWIEVVCGALLLISFFRRAAALVISALLAAFILLVIITMARGVDLVCGCLGALSGKVGWKLLAQDIVLLILALTVLGSRAMELSLDGKRSLRGAGD